jgi:hypothetical protein
LAELADDLRRQPELYRGSYAVLRGGNKTASVSEIPNAGGFVAASESSNKSDGNDFLRPILFRQLPRLLLPTTPCIQTLEYTNDEHDDEHDDFVPDVQLRLTDAAAPDYGAGPSGGGLGGDEQALFAPDRQAGMVIMPTGGGKTVVAAGWELEHHIRRGGRVLWLAHRRSLLRQSHRTFQRLGNMAYPRDHLNLITISSLDAKWSMVTKDHDVVFSSMQSAVLEGNWDFVELFLDESEHGVFVIVDEAHHAAAPGYARLLRRLKERGCKILGLTATPVRGTTKTSGVWRRCLTSRSCIRSAAKY